MFLCHFLTSFGVLVALDDVAHSLFLTIELPVSTPEFYDIVHCKITTCLSPIWFSKNEK